MRRPWYWSLWLPLLFAACASLKGSFPLASPSAGGDQTVGYKSEKKIGNIGGGGDSIALWIAIAVLGLVAVSAYPAQRGVRLAWNSWRGTNEVSRKGKGSETCIKFSEWDS